MTKVTFTADRTIEAIQFVDNNKEVEDFIVESGSIIHKDVNPEYIKDIIHFFSGAFSSEYIKKGEWLARVDNGNGGYALFILKGGGVNYLFLKQNLK